MNNNACWNDPYETVRQPRKLAPGMSRLRTPKPRCHSYHYSNPHSQEALICETPGFPAGWYPAKEEISEAYSDRMHGWDSKRFSRACEIAGGGDQNWAYKLPSLAPEKLREFAKEALNLPVVPTHVRCVHWFNVSTGYSCPTVLAIYPKQPTTPTQPARDVKG